MPPELLVQVYERCQTCGGAGHIPDTSGHPAERFGPRRCPAHCERGYHARRIPLLDLMTEMVTAAALADYPQLERLRGASIPAPEEAGHAALD